MKIHQIYTDSRLRNFTYIIETSQLSAYVIDPWNDDLVNQILNENQLNLIAVINTHEHWDHTQGNAALVEQHQCEVWAHENGKGKIPQLSRTFKGGEVIELSKDVILEILDTPGHSLAHLCFVLYENSKAQCVFSGDILFNAGVGNCHNGGNVEDLYTTIRDRLSTLNDDVVVYPGHDYLENNLNFTLNREPSNQVAKQWLQKCQHNDVFNNPLTTTIADEKEINTFLRLDSDEIVKNLPIKCETEKQVFVTLRSLRDKW